MPEINWKLERGDLQIIIQIVSRAKRMFSQVHQLDLTMDLTACHLNGCPLDLKGLLGAEKGDFMHDVVGIRTHMDRTTGKLQDCFLPRYAKPERVEA